MFIRMFWPAVVTLSTTLILSGLSPVHAAECAPHCVLIAGSNAQGSGGRSDGDHRGQGLRRANDIAGQQGSEERDNARLKQDAYRPGGSGVPTPSSASTATSVPPLDPVKLDPRVKAPTCSLC